MEGPKYQLIFIFLLLSLASLGSGVFNSAFLLLNNEAISTTQSLYGKSAFRPEISAKKPHTHFKQQIYQAYISGKMEGWRTAIDNMEKQKKNEPDFLLELINFQYGYVAWCLGKNNKNEAKNYLSLLEENLERLKNASGETAEFHAYSAAAYGFKIGLSTWRAPFFGPKSMDHAEKALAKNSQSFQANMEMGNIWNHMPALFGGLDEKALKYYLKALEIMEKESGKNRKENWMYLNLLTLIGKMQQKMGNTETARRYFEQALQIEPGFVWVKEELLPSLKTN